MTEPILDTYEDVKEKLLRCASYLCFEDSDAVSETFLTFLSAYERYDSDKSPDFENFAYQHTYYQLLNVRKRRRWLATREQAAPVILNKREAPPDSNVAVEKMFRFLNGLPEDAKYVAEFVLNPPKKIEKTLIKTIRNPDNPAETRREYRRVLIASLTKQKWTPWRIVKAFRLLENALSGFGRSNYSYVGA